MEELQQLSLSASLAASEEAFGIGELSFLDRIPPHHDVVSLRGLVVVYDPDALCREEIQDGGYYVVEHQRPVGGMSWDTYERFNHDFGRRCQPRVRIHTKRDVIQARRRADATDEWWHRYPSGGGDGPLPSAFVAHNFVGKVIGIYRSN